MSIEKSDVIERVYGVTHSFSLDVMGVYSQKGVVYPSNELLADLASLPQGSVIGIETFDPKEVKRLTRKVNGQKFYLSKEDDFYWDLIKRHCQAGGLQVVYLDDFSTFREHVAKQQEHQRLYLEYITECAYTDSTSDQIEAKERELASAVYRAAIEARYIHEVKREEKIVERMARFRPRRAIIGRGHGDYLVLNSSLLENNGLSFGDYQREWWVEKEGQVWNDFVYGHHELAPTRQAVLVEVTPDLEALVERELLIRAHRLVTEGRLLADQTPDYVGTWDLQNPLQGFFEVYVNGQAEGEPFSGIIEDCLGTADFEGEIDADWVQFLKSYREDQSSPQAAKMLMLYEGYRQNGKYEGGFSFQGKEENFKFTLNKGLALV